MNATDPGGTDDMLITDCNVTTGNPYIQKGPAATNIGGACGMGVAMIHELVHVMDVYSACQEAKKIYDQRIALGEDPKSAETVASLLYHTWQSNNEDFLECRASTAAYNAAATAYTAIGCKPNCPSGCCSDLEKAKKSEKKAMDERCAKSKPPTPF